MYDEYEYSTDIKNMKNINIQSRYLGIAFLFQFITSLSSGALVKPAWFVEGDFSASMLKIAQNPAMLQSGILLDMLTALGVIFLGAMLYLSLKKQNEAVALTALCFYVLEGALLAASRMNAFSLLRLSQEYAAAAQPDQLLLLGTVTYEAMDFSGNTLHMLAFCLGGILFYTLLFKSDLAPRALSLWGLVTVIPMLVGTIVQIYGSSIAFYFYAPYVPFEFVMGIWFMLKGVRGEKGFTGRHL